MVRLSVCNMFSLEISLEVVVLLHIPRPQGDLDISHHNRSHTVLRIRIIYQFWEIAFCYVKFDRDVSHAVGTSPWRMIYLSELRSLILRKGAVEAITGS